MPIVIPPFTQYQGTIIPLRGLWNNAPIEGDRFISIEVDWSVTTGPGNCVQITVGGNSPVSLSQIIALNVDNSRCGSDVDFLFPDSAYVLTVPAHNSLISPVLTNALMFYVSASGGGPGDVTICQILNSMPPPIMIQPSEVMNHVSETGIQLAQSSNAVIPILPGPTNGLLTGFVIQALSTDATATANLGLIDGNGKQLWAGALQDAPQLINVQNINVRFHNGIYLQIFGSDFSNGELFVNLYYTSP